MSPRTQKTIKSSKATIRSILCIQFYCRQATLINIFYNTTRVVKPTLLWPLRRGCGGGAYGGIAGINRDMRAI